MKTKINLLQPKCQICFSTTFIQRMRKKKMWRIIIQIKTKTAIMKRALAQTRMVLKMTRMIVDIMLIDISIVLPGAHNLMNTSILVS